VTIGLVHYVDLLVVIHLRFTMQQICFKVRAVTEQLNQHKE